MESKADYIRALNQMNDEDYENLVFECMEYYGARSTQELTKEQVRDFYWKCIREERFLDENCKC